jgi:multicomponent Na+:H+ antiporter subunit G
MMELIGEMISTFFIIMGVVFMMIAAIGILRLPDFYIRMSAITKAGTMGVGLIVVGIALYFNDLLIATKSFVIISFMVLTAPVGAHIIARAAYRHGVPFWGRNLIDELDDILKKREECRKTVEKEPENINARFELIDCLTSVSPAMGGSLKKAVLVAGEIKEINEAEGCMALGIIYSRGRNYKLAESEYRAAIHASGGLNRYRYALGNFYLEAEWYYKAFGIFEGIYKKNKEEIRALLETGKTAALSGKELDWGENSLKKFLNAQPAPDNKLLSQAAFYLGRIHMIRGEYSAAKQYFEKSLDYDHESYDAGFYLEKIKRK